VKFTHLLLLAALWFPGVALGQARENPYDVLSKVLMPFVGVLAASGKSPNRAVTLTLRLERVTQMPPELAGARAEIAFEAPDKLRVHGPVLGEELTICRNGQELWAHPRSKVEPLFAAAIASKKLPRADPKFRLEPFRLPIPEKQLVFLPILFQVRDAGTEMIDGEACRVLDLAPMAELARSTKFTDWSGRLWVRKDYRPARLEVSQPGMDLAVRIEDAQFAPKLPESTWQPAAEQAGDVLELTPVRYQQLLKAFAGDKD